MSYALITGASRGIGQAIAVEMASRKIDLLLVARSGDDLKSLSDQLNAQYKVEVNYLIMDLSIPGAALSIFNWCRENNYPVQYLINNAGYGLSGMFESYSIDEHLALMKVNMAVLVELCYYFLPGLKEIPSSYIMNVASSAAYQAVPFLAIYAASKSFVLQFSRALNYELRSSSVKVCCISPGSTKTGFDERANMGPKALKTAKKVQMQAKQVAKIAVNSMFRGRTEVIIGFINKLGVAFVWLLPKKLVERSAASIYQ